MGAGAHRKYWKQGSLLAQAKPCGGWTQVLWVWLGLLLPVLLGPFSRLGSSQLCTLGSSVLPCSETHKQTLHSQDSNPGSSSIRGLLPLVNPSWEYRNLKLQGVAASSRILPYLREPLPPPPPAFLDWGLGPPARAGTPTRALALTGCCGFSLPGVVWVLIFVLQLENYP